MLLLRAAEVLRACPMGDAIDAVAEGFTALSSGRATVPLRAAIPLRDGATALTMPASLLGAARFTVKVVGVAPTNRERGKPIVVASVLVGDASTGETLALLEGAALTALRTGAAGGVAARLLARDDARVMALFGAGVQARTQLLAAATVRRLSEVRVVTRDPTAAEALLVWAREQPALGDIPMHRSGAREAVRAADLIVTATSSSVPVFDGRDAGAGVHVTAVGSYTPEMRELDESVFDGASVFVDQREGALAEAGELQGLEPSDVVELGEILAGTRPGRSSREQRTVFKSVGNAIQDLVVGARVYDRARELGIGEEVTFP